MPCSFVSLWWRGLCFEEMLKGCVRGGSGWSCVGFFRRAYGVDPYIEKLKNKARKRTNWNRPASHKYDLEEAWDVIAGQLNSAVTVPVPVEIQQFQSVGIVGLPNAGKSTLVNAILRDKVSIPSRKRHTTRRQVLGVLTEGKYQVEICDVPGFLSHGIGKEEVGLERKYLAEEAWSVVESADKVVFVVDAAVSNMAKERTTRNTLIRAGKAGNMPILVMNKGSYGGKMILPLSPLRQIERHHLIYGKKAINIARY